MNKQMFLTSLLFLAVFNISKAQDSVRFKMDDYFGVNVHIDKQYTAADFPEVVDWIRDYSDWPNFEPRNNEYTFRKGKTNYDSAYQTVRQMNVKNLIVIEDIPKWISPSPEHKHAGGFAPRGEKQGHQPEDYKEAAEFFYQFTARYGSAKVPKRNLMTTDRLSGMNLMDAVEVMNEADGDTSWGNFVTIKEYAALLNAVYDGNGGTLGPKMGVKAADPNMPVSITGLGDNLRSLQKIVKACGRAPFDIVNLHFYAFRNVRENHRVAVPPEWSSLEKDMSQAVSWVKENIPDKKIWLTEIGWDSRPEYNSESVTEQESADYLIRSYLIALGAGIEKCFWYYWNDYNIHNHGVFASMGLFENASVSHSGKTQFKPKLQYWYMATMRNMLKDTYFILNNSGGLDKTIYDYHFTSTSGDSLVRVLWHCPEYSYDWHPLDPPVQKKDAYIQVPKGFSNVKMISPVLGTAFGKEEVLAPDPSGKVKLTLGSTPVFLLFE